ncbi:MAG TPA: response regulator, partial [Nitrococcus sp.]|nr:response regulator [Nitrococcus sp.]
ASTAVRAQAYVEEALRWLPDSAGRAEVAADTPVPDEMAPGCGARVLLADDNADMRAYVHRLLGAQYVVEAVADGQAALAAIRARRPDLVLADVMMPQLDGFGLLHAIRTDPALRDLPVVMLSARAGEEARVEGLETGADDYLVKPFVARELLARVDSNLTLSRLRREAVNRVRESEAQLALAIDIAGLGHWEFDPSTGALTASAQCKANFGRAADEPFSYDDLRAAIHPDDRDHQAAAVAQALESKAEFEVEYRLLTSAGELRWIDVRGRFEEGEAGGRLVGVTLDITERKRAEALQAAQTRALELIVEDAPLVQALDRLVRTIEAQSQGMLGSILLLDCDGLHLRHGAAPSLPEQYSQAIDGLDIGPEVGSCGTAAYLQKPVYVCDIATDPRWIQYRDLALPHGLRACWSTPIFSGGGELLGTFAMYYREAREPTAADLALVHVVTRAAALIIERKRTEAALRESEAHYRQLVEFLPVAVYTCKVPSGSITFCNDRAVELWGRAPEIGGAERFCGSFKCYRPDGAFLPRDQTPMALAVQKGQIFRDQEVIAERPDGTRIIALVNIDLIRDERGQVVGALNVFADITERRQNENLLMEQKRLLEMIALGAPLNDCLASLCAAVPRLNPRTRASILIADEERQRFSRSITPNLASFGRGLKGAPINDLAIGTCGETVFHVRPITCQDIANDDRWSREWRDLCVANGILACHSAPIVGVDGLPLGSFMLCFDEPQKPSEWERRLAEFGSHIASVALERDRASRALRESERHLRALSGSLEQQVEMRTAELQRQAGRLRRLAAELTSTEQRERKRLAAILHDGLQQLLVAAKMRLGLARGQVQDPAVRSTIEGAGELLDQAVDSSRDLTRQLRPPVLYEGGLIPALHWLASELPKLHDLQVAIEAQEAEPALSDDAKALLFESVRELLFNVAKHAGVKEAAVRVRSDARWLRITVVDEGAGFDIETAAQAQDPQQPGLGLFSIRERLAVLSGGVAIESSPGQGTRIALTIPLTVANRPVAGPTRPLVAPGALVQAAAAACQTRVLVVDDHAIVREGIANVLSGDERLVVVAEAADG